MSQTPQSILFIENDAGWAEAFAAILKALGENRELIVLPEGRFLKEFSTGKCFDQIALCLVDLELKGGATSALADKNGLDVVLPHIRTVAPWVPTACLSRYISESSEVIAELSCSDFDAFFPKAIVGEAKRIHPEFNADRWRSIVVDMYLRRISFQTGQPIATLKHALKSSAQLQTDTPTASALAALQSDSTVMSQALSLLDIGGTEHTVQAIDQGFSGIQVSLVRVGGFDKTESIDSAWLLKWGRPVRKLAEEANAHRLFMKRGIHRALQIPQLHRSVVGWEGIGYLVYAFEKDAKTALSVFNDHGPSGLGISMRSLCSALYRDRRRRAVNLGRTLDEWLPIAGKLAIPEQRYDRTVDVSWGLVHGDLHLRNIFVRNDAPTLIDFARSDFAPFAVDAAKLVADCLLSARHELLPQMNNIGWDECARVGLDPLMSAFQPWLSEPDDRLVFDAMLSRYMQTYLAYPDIREDRKAIVRRLVPLG